MSPSCRACAGERTTLYFCATCAAKWHLSPERRPVARLYGTQDGRVEEAVEKFSQRTLGAQI